MRLSASSGSACSGVSTSTQSTSMAMDHMKTIGSHLLMLAIFVSCSKHGRIKDHIFGIVEDAKEIIILSITIDFEPWHFAICITSDSK